jgi:hypothetical protein
LSRSDISSKTRHNIKTNLRTFFVWLTKRRVLRAEQMPEFPEIPHESGWRKTVDKETQEAILEQVRRLTTDNPRIWIGIKWLCTYISLRPSDLLGILEEDIDIGRQAIVVKSHKTSGHIGPKAGSSNRRGR